LNKEKVKRGKIMNRLTLATLMTTLAMTLVAHTARAEDFNITVPLSFTSLPPNVDGALLACWIYTGEPGRGGRSIGIGRKRVDISGGAYSGNTTLSFNVDPGQDPSLVTHYECVTSFVGNESAATVHYFTDRTGAGGVRFPLAAGAPLRLTTGVRAIPR
jgi:hypothetical protein